MLALMASQKNQIFEAQKVPNSKIYAHIVLCILCRLFKGMSADAGRSQTLVSIQCGHFSCEYEMWLA